MYRNLVVKSIYNYHLVCKTYRNTIDLKVKTEGEKQDLLESLSKDSDEKKSKIEEVKEKLGMSLEDEEVEILTYTNP